MPLKKILFFLFLQLICCFGLVAQNEKEYYVKNSNTNDQYSTFGSTFYKNDFLIFTSPKKRLQIVNRDRLQRQKRRLARMNPRRKARFLKRIQRRKITPIRSDLEFYIGITNEKGEIVKNKRIGPEINSRYDELDLVFSKNLKTVYFTRNTSNKKTKVHLELFKADVITPSYWINIRKLPFNSEAYSVGHPSLSPDGRTLYFASDMEESYGSLDIFKVNIIGEDAYSEPINLGSEVNTEGQETTPFVDENNVLYYSSNGKGGLGGLDIYAFNLNENEEAVRIKLPINSAKNDHSFKIRKDHTYGYLTSNRDDGKGLNDLYYFDELIPEEPDVTQTETKVEVETTKSEVVDDKPKIIRRNRNPNSTLSFEEFNRCQGELDKVNNILFDYDRSYIRADAARELDNVISIIRRCPNIEILVTSHTDSRSSHSYNKKLSQRRAEETVQYILTNGKFSPNRVKGIGYGETRLSNRCANGVVCSEAEHQANRRTEFEISNFY